MRKLYIFVNVQRNAGINSGELINFGARFDAKSLLRNDNGHDYYQESSERVERNE